MNTFFNEVKELEDEILDVIYNCDDIKFRHSVDVEIDGTKEKVKGIEEGGIITKGGIVATDDLDLKSLAKIADAIEKHQDDDDYEYSDNYHNDMMFDDDLGL